MVFSRKLATPWEVPMGCHPMVNFPWGISTQLALSYHPIPWIYADDTQTLLSFRTPDFQSSLTHLQDVLQVTTDLFLDVC